MLSVWESSDGVIRVTDRKAIVVMERNITPGAMIVDLMEWDIAFETVEYDQSGTVEHFDPSADYGIKVATYGKNIVLYVDDMGPSALRYLGVQ